MLESLSHKQKIVFFIILSMMICFIVYYLYTSFYKEENDTLYDTSSNIEDLVENPSTNQNISSTESLKENSIVVYICGAVNESKVISLTENSRIIDAIEAVGGLTEDADLTNVNLAYLLEDGEKIYIPKKGEQNNEKSIITSGAYFISDDLESSIPKTKVNINKAGQAELEGIPGIGPSTALKILEYRNQNGKFHSIEDIKNVSGIGDSKLEKIKEYITVK